MRLKRPSWRIGLVLFWLAITLVCGVANWCAWSPPDPLTGRTGSLDVVWKHIGNVAQTVNAPVWLTAWHGLGRYTSFEAALVINGIGFAFWAAVLALILAARRRMLARPHSNVVAAGAPAPRPPSLSRRAFITDTALITGTACAGAAGAYASFVTPWSLKTVRYSVSIEGLPRTLDGLRMVQVTDTHLGPRIPASFIKEAVDLAMSMKPDLYLLTGDYVHMGTSYIEPAAALFRPLTEPRAGLIGTIGVLGNHDHYADAASVFAAMTKVGVRMIHNGRLFLDGHDRVLSSAPRRSDVLCIAGVGDFLEGIVDVDAALRDVPHDMSRIMLSHNPDVAEDPLLTRGAHRLDLMISGHTHGGQVRLPFVGAPAIPSRFGQKYAHGLIAGPSCPVIVNAGVGMSLVPVRVGVRPEIVEITLKRA